MTSLYGRLFRYRERAARSPLEDYLTECLADLFNRFDGSTQKQLIREVFIPIAQQENWDEYSRAIDILEMETQQVILNGRIDLVVFAGSNPAIAVENKIDAPISGDDSGDQLANYGRWISASTSLAFPGIVCLLTHLTQPSEDFMKGAIGSGGAIPHVVTWTYLAAALKDIKKTVGGQRADINTLICDLLLFLQEMNMSHEFAGRDEFAAAFVYLPAGSRMDHTFETIYKHVKSLKFAAGSSIHEMSLHFDTKCNLIWGWKFLTHQPFSDLFFGYGIALSPAVTFGSASSEEQGAVFLCLGVDNKKSMQALKASKELPEKSWAHVDLGAWSAVFSFKSLHTFMAEPEKFALNMIQWIDQSEPSVREFLRRFK